MITWESSTTSTGSKSCLKSFGSKGREISRRRWSPPRRYRRGRSRTFAMLWWPRSRRLGYRIDMVKVDGSELTKLAIDAQKAAPQTRAAAVRTVKSASFAVERRIKTEMPGDTGRARASWGHADAGLLLKPNP